jgi:adenylate kinase
MTPRRNFLLLALAPAALRAQAKPLIVVLGPPGSGKTTQAARLARRLGVPVIETGALVKKEMVAETREQAAKLKDLRDSGMLTKFEMMNDLLAARLAEPDCARGAILDGYPRTASHARFVDQLAAKLGYAPPKAVVLNISEAEAAKRIAKREAAASLARRQQEFREEIAAIEAQFGGRVLRVDGAAAPDAVALAIQKALGVA